MTSQAEYAQADLDDRIEGCLSDLASLVAKVRRVSSAITPAGVDAAFLKSAQEHGFLVGWDCRSPDEEVKAPSHCPRIKGPCMTLLCAIWDKDTHQCSEKTAARALRDIASQMPDPTRGE